MKSLKSVLVVAFACAMLFAFTACEQKMPSYQQVEYVTIAQTSGYITGQEVSADGFEVTVHYLDGTSAVYPGTGRVTFGENDKKEPTVTGSVAGKSDTIVIYTTDAESAVIDVTNPEFTVLEEDDATNGRAVSFTVNSVTFSATDSTYGALSYTVPGDSGSIKVATVARPDLVNQAKLSEKECSTIGSYPFDLMVKLNDVEVATESIVTINVVAAPVGPTPDPEPTKDDVTKLGVEWKVGGEVVGTSASYEATVGDTVSYVIYGLTSENERVELTEDADFTVTGDIPEEELVASNITGYKETPESDPVKAYTATVQFIPNKELDTPNFPLNATLKLELTVDDALTQDTIDAVTPADFLYKPVKNTETNEWEPSTVATNSEVTVRPADFIAIVETEGGVEIQLQGTTGYGPTEWKLTAEDTATAGEVTSKTFTFKWTTVNKTYGAYEGVADGVTVTAAAVEDGE